MTTNVICCVGRIGSGKDSFFEIFKNLNLGKTVKRLSFADQIKTLGNELFMLNDIDCFYNRDEKEVAIDIPWSTSKLKISPREICTSFGSFCRNTYSKNFWIDRAFKNIISSDVDFCVITDVRYPNEIEYVIKNFTNYKIVFMDADLRLGPMEENPHESESGVCLIKEQFKEDNSFFTIYNNETIEDLQERIIHLV